MSCTVTTHVLKGAVVTPDLSLKEAARLYDLSGTALSRRIRNGEIEAYKSEGPIRGEWRVTVRVLEAFGYQRRRKPAPKDNKPDSGLTRRLERELAAARQEAEAQRRKAEHADRELGAAQMEVGRLRAALAAGTPRRVHAELGVSGDCDEVRRVQSNRAMSGLPRRKHDSHSVLDGRGRVLL